MADSKVDLKPSHLQCRCLQYSQGNTDMSHCNSMHSVGIQDYLEGGGERERCWVTRSAVHVLMLRFVLFIVEDMG